MLVALMCAVLIAQLMISAGLRGFTLGRLDGLGQSSDAEYRRGLSAGQQEKIRTVPLAVYVSTDADDIALGAPAVVLGLVGAEPPNAYKARTRSGSATHQASALPTGRTSCMTCTAQAGAALPPAPVRAVRTT
ncbi:MAG: hypothetical protein ACRDRK_28025 [Pseudonocardia sp.]